jgi:hypothetical protein
MDGSAGQWVGKTFLLKKRKTTAKKMRLLFCHTIDGRGKGLPQGRF